MWSYFRYFYVARKTDFSFMSVFFTGFRLSFRLISVIKNNRHFLLFFG